MARTQPNLEITNIRKELEKKFGSPLTDYEWAILRVFDYPEESPSPSVRNRALEETIEKIRRIRRIPDELDEPKNQEVLLPSEQGPTLITKRTEAISILVAQEATEDIGLRIFRAEVLCDKLLSLNEIEEWIQQQAQKDGVPSNWLNDVPISTSQAKELLKLLESRTSDTMHLSLEVSIYDMPLTAHMLKYPGLDGWERSKPTALGGVLERLRKLSDKLAEKYKWQPGHATAFVLTGGIPLISPLIVTLNTSSRPLFSRLVLDVDPALTPQELSKQYRRSRKNIITARHRNLSEKHVQLALFYSKQQKGEALAAKMDEWNKTHRAEWRYKQVSNFARDCKQARRRLLRS